MATISVISRSATSNDDVSGDFPSGEGSFDFGPESPQWERESCPRFAWQPSRQLLRAVRKYQRAKSRGGLSGK